MNREYPLALGTLPPPPLGKNKGINPLIPNSGQILKHAHAVPGTIPPIKVSQTATRGIAGTELPHSLRAVPDPAGSAVGWLRRGTPATGTDPLLPQKTAAQSAVHPAGSDHLRNNGINGYIFHNPPLKQAFQAASEPSECSGRAPGTPGEPSCDSMTAVETKSVMVLPEAPAVVKHNQLLQCLNKLPVVLKPVPDRLGPCRSRQANKLA